MSETLVGLDIGSSKIRSVVAERLLTGALQVTGVGVTDSEGLRRGDVVNIEKTVEGIKAAIESAEFMSGSEITECAVSLGGVHIEGFNSTGVVPIADKGKREREVDGADIANVIRSAQAVEIPRDRKFIHVIPQSFSVDSQKNIKDPTNVIGVRLESNVHIITSSATAIEKISQCVARSNLKATVMMCQSLCAVKSVMTNDEQELGSLLIDIGGATTNVIVMKNGAPVMTFTIGVGGNNLTSDLAIVEGISIDTAEKIKIKDGCCYLDLVDTDEEVLIAGIGGKAPVQISRMRIAEILQSRLQELFLIIKNKVEQVLKPNFLNGSIILCGGSSLLTGATELASAVFDFSSVRLGIPSMLGGLTGEYRSPEFAVVLGLLLEQNENKAGFAAAEAVKEKNKKGGFSEKMKNFWDNLF
ncbi:MAG: cell division protein FtsA [Treponemataceae bacterium]